MSFWSSSAGKWTKWTLLNVQEIPTESVRLIGVIPNRFGDVQTVSLSFRLVQTDLLQKET